MRIPNWLLCALAIVPLMLVPPALSIRSIGTLLTTVSETREIMETGIHLDDLLAQLHEVQRAGRAFALTRDPSNLHALDRARAALNDDIVQLRRSQSGDRAQFDRIASLEVKINAFVGSVTNRVLLRRDGEVPQEAAGASDRLEQELLGSIHDDVASMSEAPRAILDQARAEARIDARRTRILIVAGTAIAGLIIIVVLVVLRRRITDLREAKEATGSVNQELTRRVADLQQRSRELELLSEMGDLLQSSATTADIRLIVENFGQRLFPNDSGAVFIMSSSQNLVEVAASWGTDTCYDAVFGPDDCWALRRGTPHVVDLRSHRLCCGHLRPVSDASSVCVPMLAHGETIGVFLVRGHDFEATSHTLAKTVADHISLSLANLNLREGLQTRALHDPLTGLFNRRYLEETLERDLRRAARNDSRVGLLFVDIDHFKRFNDTFGHAGGDALLQRFAELLRSTFRDEDIVCRYGGEEFVITLPDVTESMLLARAEELRRETKNIKAMLNRQVLGNVTISIGLSLSPDHGDSSSLLIAAADGALYLAKNRGRDCVVLAEHDEPACEVIPCERKVALSAV